jgi:hypothetical protein
MNCDEVQAGDIIERYLARQLSEAELGEFEEHYFKCPRCFEDVELLTSLREELRLQPRKPRRVEYQWWAAAAAGLALIAGGAWWQLRPRPAVQLVAHRAVAQPAANRNAELELLARIDPPHYAQPVLRAGSLGSFHEAMQRYAGADYQGAIPGLTAAVKQDPTNTAAEFYLGVCYLAAGQPEAGIERLRHVVAQGDSPQLESAHLYLAKALAGQRRLDEAQAEAERAVAARGDRKAEAQRLREAILEAKQNP